MLYFWVFKTGILLTILLTIPVTISADLVVATLTVLSSTLKHHLQYSPASIMSTTIWLQSKYNDNGERCDLVV